jgi:hypothetical protein
MRVGDEHHAPVALPPAKRRSAHGTGDCVGSKDGLDGCEKWRRYRDSNCKWCAVAMLYLTQQRRRRRIKLEEKEVIIRRSVTIHSMEILQYWTLVPLFTQNFNV